MTDSESSPTDDRSTPDDSTPARSVRSDDGATASDGPDPSGQSVEALTERVQRLERLLAWMARQQAAETGTSVCPECDTGGALHVSRAPTGKKQVECTNCGERLN
ncbi:hypothetical protein [Halorussus caseinilyticus]|uniref:Halobacterial output domain-containing protein n=1 Tax=Halorussus caseinilyticus TaxID=3034025 RepID=A0ABD5WLB8_9EURY|nr:hypothetical protein [Halorussus sp. DT72]